ncbi:exopolysaccharide biosynthesis protein [Clostridia bacterium]|nr:exopolysaccharide biosynthesis protein [Clostridia bacterium]
MTRVPERFERPKRIFPVGLIVLFDFLIFAAALVVFALFHHVLPRAFKQPIVNTVITDAVTTLPPSGSDLTNTIPDGTSDDAQTPSYPLGDFTAAFPTIDTTADNAIHSYQTDNVRISIKKMKVGDAVAFVADIWVRDIHSLRNGFAKERVGQGVTDKVLDMAEHFNATVAINGDYYGARAKSVVIRDGVLYRDSLFEDVCVLYEDGVMETYTAGEFDINAAVTRRAWQAWSFGPMLLQDGKAMTAFNSSVVPANPRTAIGYYEPGHYCFVVVDGRQSGYSNGMHLKVLSQFFADLGCKTAYNLDGGQSSMMAFQGELVNQPYNGGRPSSDIIYITQ